MQNRHSFCTFCAGSEIELTGFIVNMHRPKPFVKGKRGVVGVMLRRDKLLTIRRSQWVTAPGKLCLPGGTIEEGETEEQALVREMKEELSIHVSRFAAVGGASPLGGRSSPFGGPNSTKRPNRSQMFTKSPSIIGWTTSKSAAPPRFCRVYRDSSKPGGMAKSICRGSGSFDSTAVGTVVHTVAPPRGQRLEVRPVTTGRRIATVASPAVACEPVLFEESR